MPFNYLTSLPEHVEELAAAEAKLENLQDPETPGETAEASAVKSESLDGEDSPKSPGTLLAEQGLRELERSNPDTQKFQFWSKTALASWAPTQPLVLDSDSDVEVDVHGDGAEGLDGGNGY